jgi:superfamily I DNA/RNA helicase
LLYERRGGLSIKQTTLEAIILWEKLRKGQAITGGEARRMYEVLKTNSGVKRGHKTLPGFGDEDEVTMRDLQERGGLRRTDIWHEALERIPAGERAYLLQALRKGQKLTTRPSVRLSTIHGAKGGEADHVVLFTDMAARTFGEMHQNMEDELRVWYVAATRARRRLTIMRPTRNQCFTFPGS